MLITRNERVKVPITLIFYFFIRKYIIFKECSPKKFFILTKREFFTNFSNQENCAFIWPNPSADRDVD
mgnify:CR=1 FL=1